MAKNAHSALSIQPLGDRVVVQPSPRDEATASGILIPDTAKQDKPEQGTVVAVGNGRYDGDELVPMTVQVGDTVFFSKYGYDEVKIEGEQYFILSETNVLAIIKK
jgi:chaperonin GroES